MANTYTQLYIQLVFAVAHRDRMIDVSFKETLHKYITGIIQNKANKLIAINAMREHIHIFIGLNPSIAISDLVRDVKIASTNFINDNKWTKGKFNWQEGYGAFSYSHSHIQKVVYYINNQESRHKKTTFREEYISFLKAFNLNYNDQYLFKWFD